MEIFLTEGPAPTPGASPFAAGATTQCYDSFLAFADDVVNMLTVDDVSKRVRSSGWAHAGRH